MSIIGLPTKWMLSTGRPSFGQVPHGVGAGHQEQVGQLVGQSAVDLLGHRHVEAAQSGLDVRHRDAELRGNEGGGDGRVHVAVDHDERGPTVDEQLLEPDHDRCGLRRVAARPDLQVDVRLRQAELAEEDLGHLLVVVLAGVDEQLLDAELVEGGDDRGGLREVRACACDMDDRAIRHEPEDVTGIRRGRSAGAAEDLLVDPSVPACVV